MMPNQPVSIRIVKTPAGEAPLEIRRQWVGLVIPGAVLLGEDNEEFGVETLRAREPRKKFVVLAPVALAVLSRKSRQAAQWFANRLVPGMSFKFGEDEVQVVEAQ